MTRDSKIHTAWNILPHCQFKVCALVFAILVLCVSRCSYAKDPRSEGEGRYSFLFERETITIAVTDSGLGGLSVVADIEQRMRETGMFKEVQLVFFNALFSNDLGYNSIPSVDKKVEIFDNVLTAIDAQCNPDVILIACNTLSVIYDRTKFAATTDTPVKGIVEAGVHLLEARLQEDRDAIAYLFATDTTVSEDNHRKQLVARGFLPERVITQPCPELAAYIERKFDSEDTELLIATFVDEALEKSTPPNDASVYVSLNCSHYGYSTDLWSAAFEEYGVQPTGILNPNSMMGNFLFPHENLQRYPETKTNVSIISMVPISSEKQQSLTRLLQRVSPKTADSLATYTLNRNLFKW